MQRTRDLYDTVGVHPLEDREHQADVFHDELMFLDVDTISNVVRMLDE